jgi:hypothetical protein
MYKNLSKNGQTIGFLLGAAATLIYLVIVGTGWNTFTNYGDSPERYNTTIFNFGFYAAILFVIVGVASIVGFGLTQMASNPKGAVKGLGGVAVIAAIFLISYSTASGEAVGPLGRSVENMGVTANALKLISGGITTAVVMAVLAAFAIVLSELRNFFK